MTFRLTLQSSIDNGVQPLVEVTLTNSDNEGVHVLLPGGGVSWEHRGSTKIVIDQRDNPDYVEGAKPLPVSPTSEAAVDEEDNLNDPALAEGGPIDFSDVQDDSVEGGD